MKKLNRKQSKTSWSSSSIGTRKATSHLKSFSKLNLEELEWGNTFDTRFGYPRLSDDAPPTIGWLLNFKTTLFADASGKQLSGLDLYFLQQNGNAFKSTLLFEPYLYLHVTSTYIRDVLAYVSRKWETFISTVTIVEKEDLDLKNHLAGQKSHVLKMSFRTMSDLLEVKKSLFPIIRRNQAREKANEAYMHLDGNLDTMPTDFSDCLFDVKEYDVPYAMRVAIDMEIRVGSWYSVVMDTGNVVLTKLVDMLDKAEPKVLAFDIECTKAPLKFPDAKFDVIYMISYMVDGIGYLIINRSIVSQDIEDFEYTPKSSFKGPFTVFNERDELSLLRRFYDHIIELKPHIFVTYNGDFFDWPFVEKRSLVYDLDMKKEIGIEVDENSGEYRGRCSVHLDAFCWVRRDSYLPQGSQGLKAVTKYKLGYDPVEVDPEDMTTYAAERPVEMATYSVSDAVATYYLYDQYVHLFVFSLCTIIPMASEDVLRKGSGTLCEALLMAEAYRGNIICPNKEKAISEKFFKNHLIESETYIGGHVECLESGVFRSDILYDFDLKPNAFDALIGHIDRDLTFALEVELNIKKEQVENYQEIKSEIVKQLEDLRDTPVRTEAPNIYHLDVAAMYPNIILTNRLQPCSIVDEATCASCSHNTKDATCKREMEWTWRGETYAANRPEYESIKAQLAYENVDGKAYTSLSKEDQAELLKVRLKSYCQTVYRKMKTTTVVKKKDTVCMRENPFYVNTVRAFRDRRYEYKGLTKKWKKAAVSLVNDPVKCQEAKNAARVYDSLQLAHKCILNSFYGYVMRRGARWHSMEMAGIVTQTGSSLIMRARELIEQIGRPLELDTDGIWCILPSSFPTNFSFRLKNQENAVTISYPCVMLNADVHECYTNHQYQELDSTGRSYIQRSECSIFFEVDGPYKCMVLPASTDEGRLLKKRYAVFNFDGSLAELKGFELKRRGELQLIKEFQSQVFALFLKGTSLQECYDAVAGCANSWLDVIDTKGVDMEKEEVMELLTENRSMSRGLADYGNAKSTSITTAKRLGEFLGPEMVQDKGLACKMIIANRPYGTQVTDRAIPIAIFSAEEAVMKHYLRRWLKDPSCTNFDIRTILDWDYYRARLGNSILKIISLPAAFQGISNPCIRVPWPDWMERKFRELNASMKQQKITSMFSKSTGSLNPALALLDMEDLEMGGNRKTVKGGVVHMRGKKKNTVVVEPMVEEEPLAVVQLATDEHDTWLNVRKKQWSSLRNAKKSLATGAVTSGLKTGTMTDFVTNTATSVVEGQWHLLEIQALSKKGYFQLWMLSPSQNTVQKLTIVMKRTIYVNCATPPVVPLGKKVRKILPHNISTGDGGLYQVELHENEGSEWSDKLSDVSVLGVYESHVSDLFRTLLALGTVIQMDTKSPSFSFRKTLPLSELRVSLNASSSYLKNIAFRKLILYAAQSKDRLVLGLYEATESDEQPILVGKVWYVDPYDNKAMHAVPNFTTLKQQAPETQRMVTETVTVFLDKQTAFQAMNAALGAYARESIPTIVLSQTPFHRNRLRTLIRGLESFPLISLAYASSDALFPALTWRAVVGTRVLVRSMEIVEEWNDLVECARYTNVPLGNFSPEPTIALLDTLWSRQLQQSQHVLWISPTNFPDLGGKQVLGKSFEKIERVSLPGAYHTVCVQFDLDGLAVNTMLVANEIEVIEGCHRKIEVVQTDGATFTEESVTAQFQTLRDLISTLFKSLCLSENRFADHLLQNFFRWIKSTSSLLYDPQLVEMISTLMEKLFLQLLAEMRRLGCDIIYADFGKIIVNTNRPTLESAMNMVELVTKNIGENELYRILTLSPQQYYSNLLFMDIENFGAVRMDPDDLSTTKPSVISHWNMAKYLPPGVDDYFIALVGQFIMRQSQYAMKLHLKIQEQSSMSREELKEKMRLHAEKLVSVHFMDKLFQVVPEILLHDDASSFPTLVGSHLSLKSPAVEFIKFFCHVLQLTPDLDFPVQSLKRSLLRLVHLSEYSEEAQFKNPSRSFVLPNVICTNCNAIRNLDLCRDPNLVDNINDDENERDSGWQCTRCTIAYDTPSLELRLVEWIENYSLQYQIQDLVCGKCKLPQENQLRDTCPCSGAYTGSMDVKEMKNTMETLRAIAIQHGFPWLQEAVEILLQ